MSDLALLVRLKQRVIGWSTIDRSQKRGRVAQPIREEIIAAPAESAKHEDIIDLTPELELPPSLRSSEQDEDPNDQTQLRTQAQVTAS